MRLRNLVGALHPRSPGLGEDEHQLRTLAHDRAGCIAPLSSGVQDAQPIGEPRCDLFGQELTPCVVGHHLGRAPTAPEEQPVLGPPIGAGGAGWQIGAKRRRGGEGEDCKRRGGADATLIKCALGRTGGRRQEAARLLGWGRNTLTRKIKELGLDV